MVIPNPSDRGDYNLKRFMLAKSQETDNIRLLPFDNVM